MSDFNRGTRRFDDVEAASFSPDDTDLTVTEDGGDWVAKDDVGNVVLRYDEAVGGWVMGSLKTEEGEITNETLIQANLGSNLYDAPASEWTDLGQDISIDVRGEQSGAVVTPDKSGIYRVEVSARFSKGSDQDLLEIRILDVDAAEAVDFGEARKKSSGTEDYLNDTLVVSLNANTDYKIQVRNRDSQYDLYYLPSCEYLIERTIIQP